MQTQRLKNKTAIITGAVSGIGASLAEASFSQAGAKIVVADIEDTNPCVNRIEKAGGAELGVKVDITNPEDLQTMVQQVTEHFTTIDVPINHAGLLTSLAMQPFWEINDAESGYTVNTRGAFQCIKAVLPSMRKQDYGKIINIASSSFKVLVTTCAAAKATRVNAMLGVCGSNGVASLCKIQQFQNK